MNSETLKIVKCPICHKPASWAGNQFRPFCSERCRTIDLGAWAGEEYRVPGEQKQEDDESDS